SAAMYGQLAGSISEQDRLTNIRVRYPDSFRFDRESLEQMPIHLVAQDIKTGSDSAAATGGGVGAAPSVVPLSQLATIELMRTPNERWRENQQPEITVTAEPGESDLATINRQLQEGLATINFPPGYRWELAGSYEARQESFASLMMVLLVASALVYL